MTTSPWAGAARERKRARGTRATDPLCLAVPMGKRAKLARAHLFPKLAARRSTWRLSGPVSAGVDAKRFRRGGINRPMATEASGVASICANSPSIAPSWISKAAANTIVEIDSNASGMAPDRAMIANIGRDRANEKCRGRPTLDEMGPGVEAIPSKRDSSGSRSTLGRPGMRGGWKPQRR
jgi:hypothetical protein